MSFLGFQGKTFLVLGVANKRSVAYRVAQMLEQEGATVIYSVRSEARRESLSKLLEGREIHVCDVERDEDIASLRAAVAEKHDSLDGI
ncbi:MAG: SDR family oxidoreductase, partial [Phycisphaerae bacterium]